MKYIKYDEVFHLINKYGYVFEIQKESNNRISFVASFDDGTWQREDFAEVVEGRYGYAIIQGYKCRTYKEVIKAIKEACKDFKEFYCVHRKNGVKGGCLKYYMNHKEYENKD